jgi:hypothetical protein
VDPSSPGGNNEGDSLQGRVKKNVDDALKYALQGDFDNALSVLQEGLSDTVVPGRILYHYSVSQRWRGSVLPPNSFLTDNPKMGSKEARSKLALPNVAPGQMLYLYEVLVSPGDVTPANGRPVDPMRNRITRGVLKGGGTEYISIVPLAMPMLGIPVGP